MNQHQSNIKSKLTILAGISCVSFTITLAMLIGSKLSDQALAVLSGAACGVSAAIPTSLLIVGITYKQRQPQVQPQQQNQYPPIVVVGQQPMPAQLQQPGHAQDQTQTTMEYAPQPRTFTVVGKE